MSDRALFAAFQKVKAQVDGAVSATREKEAKARAEEEKAKAQKKARVVKAAEAKKEKTSGATISASAFSAKGGFGEALASAARSSGASFRMAGSSSPKKKQHAVTVEPKAPNVTQTTSQAKPQTNRRPNSRPLQTSRQDVKRKDNQLQKASQPLKPTEGAKARPARLSYEERRNPVPPFTLMPGLPVSERGEEVAKAIRDNRVVIVCGETGSGKTTQLPKIAMMAGRGVHGMIAHTQPRRIAASSIAKRIAEELKTEPGEVVGYKVRFTDTMSPGATIKLMTDGILLAETQHDPQLRQYDTIIIDEAHERSINIDFCWVT